MYSVVYILRHSDLSYVCCSYTCCSCPRVCCLPLSYSVCFYDPHEVGHDGVHIYGVEVELPSLLETSPLRRLFFWSAPHRQATHLYEDAAIQALACLQSIYGFTILDYNSAETLRSTQLSTQLFSVANRGAQLAKVIVTAAEYGAPSLEHIVTDAEQLLNEIDTMINPS